MLSLCTYRVYDGDKTNGDDKKARPFIVHFVSVLIKLRARICLCVTKKKLMGIPVHISVMSVEMDSKELINSKLMLPSI